MIVFADDQLAPPELCAMLLQLVPEEYHSPVVFFNHPHPSGPRVLGECLDGGRRIDICLNAMFREACHRPGSLPAALWHTLLWTSLHEFGHVATIRDIDERLSVNAHLYDPRMRLRLEDMAERWAIDAFCRLRDYDSRLAQPARLRGYLGAQLVKRLDGWYLSNDPACIQLCAKERRCDKTGGQFSSGEVLDLLGINRLTYLNAYRRLRAASEGVGTEVVDRAGGTHKLYTWGDLPIIGERLARDSRLVPRCDDKPEIPCIPVRFVLFDDTDPEIAA